MKYTLGILSFLMLVVCCKKPFPQTVETVLALPTEAMSTGTSIVFIAGFDEGDNSYYKNAKAYFEGKNMILVDSLFSVAEIITWLNDNSNHKTTFDQIHIVSHSNPWLGMSLKTTEQGERISVATLNESKADNELPIVKYGIKNATQLIFHSCGLGQNLELLQELKLTFATNEAPKVYASSFFNVFGGKYAAHYLAKPFYNFYPTAESPGPAALSKEFREMYGNEKIDWRNAMKTRRETILGQEYSYKFNIPVEWEFTFDNTADLPRLQDKEAIMDWISESPEMAETLYRLNIPLEKYRWKSEIRGNKLTIKGKTTVFCVLKPILDAGDKNEYRIAKLSDTELYQIL